MILVLVHWLAVVGAVFVGSTPTDLAALRAASVHAAPSSQPRVALGRAGDGTFGRPFSVTPVGTRVDDGGSAAVNADGRVVAAWTAAVVRGETLVGDQIQARIGDMQGRFGQVLKLSDDTAQANNGPLVAVGRDGTAAVIWVQGEHTQRIRLAVAPPGRRFGTAQAIGAGDDVRLVGLTVGTGGAIAAAWRVGFTYRHRYAHLVVGLPDHVRPVLGGRRGNPSAGESFVAAPDGSALMTLANESEPSSMRAVVVAPGATSAAPPIEVPAGRPFAGPGGFAIGVGGGPSQDQQVVTRRADGSFGPPRRVGPYLGETEAIVRDTIGPDIALPGDGSLSGSWEVSRALNGDNDDEIVAGRILAASAPAAGRFGTPQRLSRTARTAEDPDTAAVGNTTVVIWRESVGALNPPFSVNFSSRRAGQPRFGGTQRFRADGWIFPILNAAGPNMVASWYPFNGYRARHEQLMLTLWHEPS